VTNGIRCLALILVGVFLLVASSAALADETTWQLVVPPTYGTGCAGFPHETIDGTVIGCTPNNAGVAPSGFFSVAADGSVAFETWDGAGIWLAKPDGSFVHLDDSPGDGSPTISYDGSKVAFSRYDSVSDSTDLYSVNADGSDPQLVVSGKGKQYLWSPSISPDGSTVAYWCTPADQDDDTSRRCGPLTDGSYRNNGLMRVDIDGNNRRMILIGPGDNLDWGGPSGVSWSPDSQWLAMSGALTVNLGDNVWSAQDQLFDYRTDGSDLFNNADPTRQITHVEFSHTKPRSPTFPRFSPDGSHLLYMDYFDSGGNEGNFSYLIGTDGSNPHQVFLNDGGYAYDAFVPTATPTAPPPLVDMTHITVPSVAALRVRAASRRLGAHHLTVGTVGHEYSASVGKHVVASQFPVAGAVAHRTQKRGPHVDLLFSLGAAPEGVPLCVVPRVKNESLWEARHAITAANCTVGRIAHVFSRTVKKGHIVYAAPGASTHLPLLGKVAFAVSKGRRR